MHVPPFLQGIDKQAFKLVVFWEAVVTFDVDIVAIVNKI